MRQGLWLTNHETGVMDESYGAEAAAGGDEGVGGLHTRQLADPGVEGRKGRRRRRRRRRRRSWRRRRRRSITCI